MRFGHEDSRPFDSNLDSSTAPGSDKGAGHGHPDQVPWAKTFDGHVEHGQIRVVRTGHEGRDNWEDGTDLNDETGIGNYPM